MIDCELQELMDHAGIEVPRQVRISRWSRTILEVRGSRVVFVRITGSPLDKAKAETIAHRQFDGARFTCYAGNRNPLLYELRYAIKEALVPPTKYRRKPGQVRPIQILRAKTMVQPILEVFW